MVEDLKSAVYDYLLVNCVQPIRWFSEREIAEYLQVTRSSVREVLLFMEGEGVVSRVPQRGYRCVDYSSGDRRALDLVRFTLEHAAVMKALTAAQQMAADCRRDDAAATALAIHDALCALLGLPPASVSVMTGGK